MAKVDALVATRKRAAVRNVRWIVRFGGDIGSHLQQKRKSLQFNFEQFLKKNALTFEQKD